MNIDASHVLSFIFTILGTAITGLFALCVSILSKLNGNIQDLNVKIAIVVEKLESHESRISKLEDKDL